MHNYITQIPSKTTSWLFLFIFFTTLQPHEFLKFEEETLGGRRGGYGGHGPIFTRKLFPIKKSLDAILSKNMALINDGNEMNQFIIEPIEGEKVIKLKGDRDNNLDSGESLKINVINHPISHSISRQGGIKRKRAIVQNERNKRRKTIPNQNESNKIFRSGISDFIVSLGMNVGDGEEGGGGVNLENLINNVKHHQKTKFRYGLYEQSGQDSDLNDPTERKKFTTGYGVKLLGNQPKLIEGIRVPDDESDKITWRNGRVINNIFFPNNEGETPHHERNFQEWKETLITSKKVDLDHQGIRRTRFPRNSRDLKSGEVTYEDDKVVNHVHMNSIENGYRGQADLYDNVENFYPIYSSEDLQSLENVLKSVDSQDKSEEGNSENVVVGHSKNSSDETIVTTAQLTINSEGKTQPPHVIDGSKDVIPKEPTKPNEQYKTPTIPIVTKKVSNKMKITKSTNFQRPLSGTIIPGYVVINKKYKMCASCPEVEVPIPMPESMYEASLQRIQSNTKMTKSSNVKNSAKPSHMHVWKKTGDEMNPVTGITTENHSIPIRSQSTSYTSVMDRITKYLNDTYSSLKQTMDETAQYLMSRPSTNSQSSHKNHMSFGSLPRHPYPESSKLFLPSKRKNDDMAGEVITSLDTSEQQNEKSSGEKSNGNMNDNTPPTVSGYVYNKFKEVNEKGVLETLKNWIKSYIATPVTFEKRSYIGNK